MSVKQNLFVSVFVHECLVMLNDVEYTTFKMFVTQMGNYLFVNSFQLMFYKTLRYRLARAYFQKLLTAVARKTMNEKHHEKIAWGTEQPRSGSQVKKFDK